MLYESRSMIKKLCLLMMILLMRFNAGYSQSKLDAKVLCQAPKTTEDITNCLNAYPNDLPLTVQVRIASVIKTTYEMGPMPVEMNTAALNIKELKATIENTQKKFFETRQQINWSVAEPTTGDPISSVLEATSAIEMRNLSRPLEKMLEVALDEGVGTLLNVTVLHDATNRKTFEDLKPPENWKIEEVRSFVENASKYLNDAFKKDQVFRTLNELQKARIVDALRQRVIMLTDEQINNLDRAQQVVQIPEIANSIESLLLKTEQVQGKLAAIQKTELQVEDAIDTMTTLVTNNETANKLLADEIAQLKNANIGQVPEHIKQKIDEKVSEYLSRAKESEFLLGTIDGLIHGPLINDIDINIPFQFRNFETIREQVNNVVNGKATIAETVNSAAAALDFAKFAGVDPHIIGQGKQAIAMGMQVKAIASSIISGNYIGAAAAILGFGGGDQPDAGQQQILGQLSVMNQKLDTILDNQKLMMKQLVQIEKQITELTNTVIKNHQEQMVKLEDILVALEYVDAKTADLFKVSAKECFELERVLLEISEPYNSSLSELFTDCKATLSSLVTIDSGSQKVDYTSNFWLTRLDDLNNETSKDDYIKKYLEPTFVEFHKVYGNQLFPILLLSAPSSTFDELDHKLRRPRNITNDQKGLNYSANYNPRNFFSITPVDRYLRWTHIIRSIQEITTSDGQPLSDDQLRDPKTFGPKWHGRDASFLKRALALTDLAIAQQALVSGDILLTKFAEILNTGSTEVRDPIVTILQTQMENKNSKEPLLAQNLVLYMLKKRIKTENGHEDSKYLLYTALTGEDCSSKTLIIPSRPPRRMQGEVVCERNPELEGLTQTKKPDGSTSSLDFRSRDGAWYIVFPAPKSKNNKSADAEPPPDVELPIPNYSEFISGRFSFSLQLMDLLNQRTRLVDAMASLRLTRTAEENSALNTVLSAMAADRLKDLSTKYASQ